MASRADRNNNPGNLRPGVGKVIWNGQTGTDADGFAVFSSKDAGIRAADLNLQSYGKHGFDTISEIIHRWSKTDQETYTSSVATGLHVDPNAPVDLTNANVRQSILAQIFNVEGSDTRYSAGTLQDSWADIQKAVNSGDPVDILTGIGGGIGTLGDNIINVFDDAASGAGDAISNAWNFDLNKWINDQLKDVLTTYLVPVAIAAGAIILIMVSSWGLVKDTPAGSIVKTGAKVAKVAAFI